MDILSTIFSTAWSHPTSWVSHNIELTDSLIFDVTIPYLGGKASLSSNHNVPRHIMSFTMWSRRDTLRPVGCFALSQTTCFCSALRRSLQCNRLIAKTLDQTSAQHLPQYVWHSSPPGGSLERLSSVLLSTLCPYLKWTRTDFRYVEFKELRSTMPVSTWSLLSGSWSLLGDDWTRFSLVHLTLKSKWQGLRFLRISKSD